MANVVSISRERGLMLPSSIEGSGSVTKNSAQLIAITFSESAIYADDFSKEPSGRAVFIILTGILWTEALFQKMIPYL
jgi:hypothetical protein